MKQALRAARLRARVLKTALARQFESRKDLQAEFKAALAGAARSADLVRIDGHLASRHFDVLVLREIALSGGKLTVADAARSVATRLIGGEPILVSWDKIVESEVRRLDPPERLGAQVMLTRLLRKGRAVVDAFLERLRVAHDLPGGQTVETLGSVAAWSNGLERDALRALEEAARAASRAEIKRPAIKGALDAYLASRQVRELGVRKAVKFASRQGQGDLVGVALRVNKKPLEFRATPLTKQQVVRSRRGTSVAEPGDWLLTGLEGEIWSVKKEVFARLYDPVPGKPGSYVVRPRILRTWQIDRATTVKSPYGSHAGRAGDWVMEGERGPDGKPVRWIVERSIVNKGWNLASG